MSGSKWKLRKIEILDIYIHNVRSRFNFLIDYIGNKKLLDMNKGLKGICNKKSCVLIGNGPSLRDIDISKINKDIFCVNEFILSNKFNEHIPNFYCFADPCYWTKEKYIEIMVSTIKKSPKTIFFIPIGAYKILRKEVDIKNVFFIDPRIILTDNYDKEFDLSWAIPGAQNVMVYSIMIAIYLGFTEIYLLGCDFNSFATPKAQHFYDEDVEGTIREISMEFELRAYSIVCREHRILNDYCRRRNINVYNATKNSLLDVYERKDLFS